MDFAGENLDGTPMAMSEFRGKPMVLVVWGSWCAPCRVEAPELVKAAVELGPTAQFVGINIRDLGVANSRSFVRRFNVPYPSFFSPDGRAMLAFSGTLSPRSIPAFVILDAEGRIAASIIGPLPSRRTLLALVDTVVAESANGSIGGPADEPEDGPERG